MLRLVTLLCLSTAAFGTPFQGVSQLDGRIVGGDDGKIEDNPYLLSLQIAGTHECGAIIISEQWALTAAQCVGGSILGMNLRAGTINRVADDETDGTSHKVTQKIVHPDYDSTTSDSDIALLKVDPYFGFKNTIGPVKLPLPDANVVTGTKKTVTGWGNTQYGGLPSKTLQVVEVSIVNRAKCSTDYGEVGPVTDNMICAGITNGGKDACQGDSGGPLVAKDADPAKDELVGIVSWGRGCALAAYPGVYTKVSAFVEWITTNAV